MSEATTVNATLDPADTDEARLTFDTDGGVTAVEPKPKPKQAVGYKTEGYLENLRSHIEHELACERRRRGETDAKIGRLELLERALSHAESDPRLWWSELLRELRTEPDRTWMVDAIEAWPESAY